MIAHIQLTEKCNVLCGYHLVEKDCDFHVLILMGKKKKTHSGKKILVIRFWISLDFVFKSSRLFQAACLKPMLTWGEVSKNILMILENRVQCWLAFTVGNQIRWEMSQSERGMHTQSNTMSPVISTTCPVVSGSMPTHTCDSPGSQFQMPSSSDAVVWKWGRNHNNAFHLDQGSQ